jgi:hypothetical protein
VKTLEEKEKEFASIIDISSLEDLKKAYINNTKCWKLLKEIFVEKMYVEWSKHPNVSQYHHQITYKIIKEMTDSEIYNRLSTELKGKLV